MLALLQWSLSTCENELIICSLIFGPRISGKTVLKGAITAAVLEY